MFGFAFLESPRRDLTQSDLPALYVWVESWEAPSRPLEELNNGSVYLYFPGGGGGFPGPTWGGVPAVPTLLTPYRRQAAIVPEAGRG